jgi:hypothetical protein
MLRGSAGQPLPAFHEATRRALAHVGVLDLTRARLASVIAAGTCPKAHHFAG